MLHLVCEFRRVAPSHSSLGCFMVRSARDASRWHEKWIVLKQVTCVIFFRCEGMNGQRLSQGKCPKASSPPTCQSLEIHSRRCIGRCVSESGPEPWGWTLGGRCVFNMFSCRRKAKLGAALEVRESQPKPKAFSPPAPRVIFLEHHNQASVWVWRKCKSRHRPRLASLRWGDLTGRHKQPWGWVARRRAQPK